MACGPCIFLSMKGSGQRLDLSTGLLCSVWEKHYHARLIAYDAYFLVDRSLRIVLLFFFF